MSLARLLAASVGPLVTFERCQSAICACQFRRVRPSFFSSGLKASSRRSRASSSRASAAVVRSGMRQDAARGLGGVPGVADFAFGVVGGEQAPQLGAASVGDALGGLEQQPAYPVEGVVLGAPPAGGLVLDAAADVVDRRVGEPDHVEWVGDLAGVGQRVGERLAIGARQVHDAPAHSLAPSRRAGADRSGRPLGAAACNDVQQDAAAGAPRWWCPSAVGGIGRGGTSRSRPGPKR